MLISDFVEKTSGLRLDVTENTAIQLRQLVDGRTIDFKPALVEEVLERYDAEGLPFLQVNFSDGRKILLTDTLIGFKPGLINGIDLSKMPKVVTTPDLMSVFDAIHDLMSNPDDKSDADLQILRKICESILFGGERTGFDLKREKLWLAALGTGQSASA